MSREERDNREIEEIKRRLEPYSRRGLKDLPAETLVELADKMGRYLQRLDVKTTQIRRFLDGVRKIDIKSRGGEEFDREGVILLKPKLAYAAKEKKLKPLMEVLEPAITAGSHSYSDFKKLLAFIEGIVAYHRFHGGKE